MQWTGFLDFNFGCSVSQYKKQRMVPPWAGIISPAWWNGLGYSSLYVLWDSLTAGMAVRLGWLPSCADSQSRACTNATLCSVQAVYMWACSQRFHETGAVFTLPVSFWSLKREFCVICYASCLAFPGLPAACDEIAMLWLGSKVTLWFQILFLEQAEFPGGSVVWFSGDVYMISPLLWASANLRELGVQQEWCTALWLLKEEHISFARCMLTMRGVTARLGKWLLSSLGQHC